VHAQGERRAVFETPMARKSGTPVIPSRPTVANSIIMPFSRTVRREMMPLVGK